MRSLVVAVLLLADCGGRSSFARLAMSNCDIAAIGGSSNSEGRVFTRGVLDVGSMASAGGGSEVAYWACL
jgi:hypothetical protein